MDAAATETHATGTTTQDRVTVDAGRGRAPGRGRGRGRGSQSRGRGRGRGRGGRGGATATEAEDVPQPVADAIAQAQAGYVPQTMMELLELGLAASSAPGDTLVPKKRTGNRNRDKKNKEKNKGDAAEGDAERKEKKPRVVPELTPTEKFVDAIRRNDREKFDAVLAENAELNVNARTRQGDAALVEAARYARLDMVKTLIDDRRADVNARSTNEKGGREGLRAIHAAVMALDEKIVDAILHAPEQTVDLMAVYDVAIPATIAVFYCVANGYTEDQQRRAIAILKMLLSHAKLQGDAKLQKILEKETEKGNRLVHIAVTLANYEAVSVLKEYGADLTAVAASGLSSLQLVEGNSFHRRSFAISRLPLRLTSEAQKNQPRKRKSSAKDAATKETKDEEPESAAEKEIKVNRGVRLLERDVENACVLQTLLQLIDVFGLGPVFSRKGNDGIRSIHIKSLVLAREGIVPVINKIAALPDDDKKNVYVDGVMHCVASLHGLTLKHDKNMAKLWKEAFPIASKDAPTTPTVPLSEAAIIKIIETLLEHKSLSRRIKVWTMILVKSLGLYERDTPAAADEKENALPVSIFASGKLFERIAETIYRSGCKMLFSLFDRTEMDEDECYDEELEFHLFIALTELFFQLFIPFSRVLQPEESVATTFARLTGPIKQLWPLLAAALHNLDETFGSPQRLSLVLHGLQVFEIAEDALRSNEHSALQSLFKTLKTFARHELSRKHMVYETAKQVQLFQNISESFALPASLVEKVHPMKDKLDLLLRSDAKILGLDLYAFARQEDFVRLQHKVDYLEVLSEEQSSSVNITISRTSEANYVEFILQQILSTSANRMKGELDVSLVDEPGVGAGVVREFFQIIQHTFFNTQPLEGASRISTAPPPAHVTEIGSQWLQLAREQSPHRGGRSGKSKQPTAPKPISDILRFFPLFQHASDNNDALRTTPRKLRASQTVIEEKQQAKTLHLTAKELLVNEEETKALKQLYLCAGRLLGLAIRDQQPLDANFPIAFWKYMLFEKVTWEDWCGSNDVFKRSLQFILDHDFDAEPMELQFEYTADVLVMATDEVEPAKEVTTVAMEIELPGGTASDAVTNENKARYVELRAKQFFFGNEFEFYKQMRDGLGDTIRKVDLKLFLPAELQRVVLGDRRIDFTALRKSVIYSRGAAETIEVIRNFWEVVESFDQPMREKLLTFWSGSALPPLFGFEATNRTNSHAAHWYLDLEPASKSELCPTANTCDRRLMLPQYPTKEKLREKLLVALEHGAVGYDRM